MAYLSKELILKSYLTLSALTEDHKQGQTQIVSAIRHLFALDMFYKSEEKDCDLNNNDDKSLFVENVKKLVNIKDDYYTTNFYTTIKPIEDCGVGSNFTSAGVVNNSKQNTSQTYDYPTRGQHPLFNVRNAVAIRRQEYYKNIRHYLNSETIRAAFAIWILRNEYFAELNLNTINRKLQSILTPELIEAFMPKDENLISFIEGFSLSDMKYQTEPSDMLNLFQGSKSRVSGSRNYNHYLSALRTKPFMLLAGISGTGKSRIVRKLAQASVTEELQRKYDPKSVEKGFDRWQLHKPANFEIVQVKPNWHNSLEVVGYKSNIGVTHYEYTPFVEFLARAWKHQDIPFFLCLDEMNLAPVEQYFAEFLSAIESRSMEHGDYETDPIIRPFDDFGEDVCAQMLNHFVGKVDAAKAVPGSLEAKLVERFKTKGLTLPKNLFVLGTVNMDETTFSFSRKVLDRAMSIVMNKVEYDKFFTGETENDMVEFDENIKNLLIDRPIRGLDAEENESDKVEEYLTAVNNVLDETPFKLGYRAANEALLYVSAAHQFDSDATVEAALDEFTLMKILSRIEGDKRSIGTKLDELQEVINESTYPKSNKKLQQMADTLRNKQFVSYWT